VFTSGATESNNIAVKGVARFYKGQNKNHIITTATVRSSVSRLSSLVYRLESNRIECRVSDSAM